MEGPIFNLIVLRSNDILRLAEFYSELGLKFERHRHGSGPEHLSAKSGETTFEIYPRQGVNDPTIGVRIGFRVQSLDSVMGKLVHLGAEVVSGSKDSPWGRRAVVRDPDGHKIELIEGPE